MMCAKFLRSEGQRRHGRFHRISGSAFNLARWVTSDDANELKKFIDANQHRVALDAVDAPLPPGRIRDHAYEQANTYSNIVGLNRFWLNLIWLKKLQAKILTELDYFGQNLLWQISEFIPKK